MSPEEEFRQITRRSLLWTGVSVCAGLGFWKYFTSRAEQDGILAPLRQGELFNEKIARAAFREQSVSPTFAKSQLEELRVNGLVGISDAQYDSITLISQGRTQLVPISDIHSMPKIEMITQLRCVEGWSRINHWAGASLRDFLRKYAPGDESKYIYMETPNRGYYVGLDRESVQHPQTMLCYEMNFAPINLEHGAPLRLAMPVKYGYKQLKQIAKIELTNRRPPDYWAKLGYDWYAGL